jgi:hypothetical protein
MPQIGQDPDVQNLYSQLTTMAMGTKIPQVRNPLKGPDDD